MQKKNYIQFSKKKQNLLLKKYFIFKLQFINKNKFCRLCLDLEFILFLNRQAKRNFFELEI